MRRAPLLCGALLLPAVLVPLVPGARAADPPSHTVTVSGTGVSTWPAYDTGIGRFAIDTGPDTGGTIEVTATSTDPDATVTVDGRQAVSGQPFEVDGLRSGDEVAVTVTDAAGTSHQSFVYLPAGFPRITEAGSNPGGDPVWVGLSSFLSTTGYEAVLDDHGVPLHVRAALEPNDFTAQPHGPASTVFEPVKDSPDDTEYGYAVREYDARYRLTGTRRLTPVPRLGITPDDTDFHDVLYPRRDRVVLVGYHRDHRPDGTPWLDAVIQVTDAAGHPVTTWTSKGRVDPSEARVLGAKGQDYAHLNSVQLLPGGDLLASFRNTGQVLRIAPDGHVVWRLGGDRGEFGFVDDPDGGFCAQHDARMLPDGHLLVFDNGSRRDATGPIAPQTADMCPDPAGGPGLVARPQTRIAEYALDTEAMTATLVWSFTPPSGRYAPFAGSAQRLPDGDTLVGWSDARTDDGSVPPFTSLVSPSGQETWSLSAEGWFSYRVRTAPAPDAIRPRIAVSRPAEGATYLIGLGVVPDVTCTDRGGSGLAACDHPQVVDTSTTGRRSFTVTASDAAGNVRTRTVHYRVAPRWQPRVQASVAGGPWRHRLRLPLGHTRHARVRMVNDGVLPDRFTITATSGNRAFDVRYVAGGRDVTRPVTHDGLFGSVLQGGESERLTIVATPTAYADPGSRLALHVRALSREDRSASDRATVVLIRG